jgi:transposase
MEPSLPISEPLYPQESPQVLNGKPGVETRSLKEQIARLIQVAPRRNIRLESTLDKEIERFVQDQNLTIETLLEACYLTLQEDADLKDRVISQASERLAERKKAGKLRRIYSQVQKLNE